jgi:hypothetical protein
VPPLLPLLLMMAGKAVGLQQLLLLVVSGELG